MSAALREEVEGLSGLSVPELKAKYVEAFGERSRSGNAAFLRKRIAWRLQARAMGGLSERARRRAEDLADEADLRVRAPGPSRRSRADGTQRRGRADASRPRRDPRLPAVGELLVRVTLQRNEAGKQARSAGNGKARSAGFSPYQAFKVRPEGRTTNPRFIPLKCYSSASFEG